MLWFHVFFYVYINILVNKSENLYYFLNVLCVALD